MPANLRKQPNNQDVALKTTQTLNALKKQNTKQGSINQSLNYLQQVFIQRKYEDDRQNQIQRQKTFDNTQKTHTTPGTVSPLDKPKSMSINQKHAADIINNIRKGSRASASPIPSKSKTVAA